jgi:hypothetical protein
MVGMLIAILTAMAQIGSQSWGNRWGSRLVVPSVSSLPKKLP